MINISRSLNIYQIIWKAKIYLDYSNLITNYKINNWMHHCISNRGIFNTIAFFLIGLKLWCWLSPPFMFALAFVHTEVL